MELISDIKKIFFKGTAIYISDDFIDIALGDSTILGARVTFLQRFPLLKNIKSLSYADAKDEMDRVLQKVFETEGDKPYRAAVNLKNDLFVLRHFTLREVPANEVRHAITFEAQKYLPYSIDDMTYGYNICFRKGGSQEVAFAASETRNVNDVAEYFKYQNILPSVIEPTPVLLTRALCLDKRLARDLAYIIIHYEPTNKVVIAGISHRQPHFFKEIRVFPGEEEFKTSELVYPPLKDVWQMIQNDVISSMEYLRKDVKQDIAKVFISGFGQFTDEQDIAKGFGVPFERLEASFMKGSRSIEDPDRYLPALALLYDSLAGPFLNLAPQEVARKDLWALRRVAGFTAMIFLGVMAIHMLLTGVGYYEAAKLKALRAGAGSYRAISPELSTEEVVRYKEELERKVSFLDNILATNVALSDKLAGMGKYLTANAWIESFSYKNTIDENPEMSLKISGSIVAGLGAESADANDLLERMKKDERIMRGFKDIELASVRKRKLLESEITDFEILLR